MPAANSCAGPWAGRDAEELLRRFPDVELVGIDYREPSKETGAAQAEAWGMVNHVVPREDLAATVDAIDVAAALGAPFSLPAEVLDAALPRSPTRPIPLAARIPAP